MKNTIITLLVIILVGIGVYFIVTVRPKPVDVVQNQATTTSSTELQGGQQADKSKTVIGTSVEGRDITAYHFGSGDTELLFIGGIHGGYEWNTVLVAYQLMNYLKKDPTVIPANIKVTVIPALNPDGLNKVVGTTTDNFTKANVSTSADTVVSGRFNANNVDLNRNFDCDWQSTGTWQTKTVSGGSAAFSEPESQAVKNYVETNKPAAVVVWFSAAGGVYASNCHNGVSAETDAITKMYADASGYPAYKSFDFYATTGDITNWLAKSSIPAISVLLTNHTDVEWTKNLAGIQALLKHYAKQ